MQDKYATCIQAEYINKHDKHGFIYVCSFVFIQGIGGKYFGKYFPSGCCGAFVMTVAYSDAVFKNKYHFGGGGGGGFRF